MEKEKIAIASLTDWILAAELPVNPHLLEYVAKTLNVSYPLNAEDIKEFLDEYTWKVDFKWLD